MVAGQHRDRARVGAPHDHDRAAGAARDTAAAHVAQVAADQPGARAQPDPSPAARIRRSAVGWASASAR